MNTTDQLFNNTILFQDTENIEGTVKNVYLDLSNAFQYIGLGNTKLYITFIAEI